MRWRGSFPPRWTDLYPSVVADNALFAATSSPRATDFWKERRPWHRRLVTKLVFIHPKFARVQPVFPARLKSNDVDSLHVWGHTLQDIKKIVEAAATAAGSSAARYAVPFPGMGHQRRFRDEMARIIPMLPRIGVA